MYSFDSRVTYSEVDHNGRLSIPAVVNYFQDCSLFHSHDVGLGLDFLLSHHRAWLLCSWQIIFNEFPPMAERVTITTWPYAFERLYGYRNFTLTDENNQILAYANSDWFYFNSENGRPTRPTPEEFEPYGCDDKLDMDYKSRKIQYPDDMKLTDKVRVTNCLLDTNHHVNNGEYVRIACGYLPMDFPVHAMRVEYRKAAKLGNDIYIYIHEDQHFYYITLCNETGEPYTILEFERREE